MRQTAAFTLCAVVFLGIGMHSVGAVFGQESSVRRASPRAVEGEATPHKFTTSGSPQSVSSFIPNDPQFSPTVCALQGNCDQVYTAQVGLTAQRQVAIVIMDGGTKPHVDLPSMSSAWSLDLVGGPIPDNHGTDVFSTAGAITNNAKGVASPTGLKPDITFGDVRFLDQNGEAPISMEVDGFNAISAMMDRNPGVKVIVTCSFGHLGYTNSLLDAVTRLTAKGAVLVAAAGQGSAPGVCDFYPACFRVDRNNPNVVVNPNVIRTAALNAASDGVDPTSGPADIAAPGVNVPVVSFLNPETGAASFSGISATPGQVAGELALLLAYKTGDVATAIARVLFTATAHPISGLAFGRMDMAAAFASSVVPPSILAVLDSVTNMAGPFPLVSTYFNVPATTEVALFVSDLNLQPGETKAAITVKAIYIGGSKILAVSDLRSLDNPHSFIERLTVPLTLDPAVKGNVDLSIIVHGLSSNTYTITIK